VRIHLDEVVGLGRVLECDAVLGPGVDPAAGHAQVRDLIERFAIRPDDLLPGSYGEMVLSAANSGRSGAPGGETANS